MHRRLTGTEAARLEWEEFDHTTLDRIVNTILKGTRGAVEVMHDPEFAEYVEMKIFCVNHYHCLTDDHLSSCAHVQKFHDRQHLRKLFHIVTQWSTRTRIVHSK